MTQIEVTEEKLEELIFLGLQDVMEEELGSLVVSELPSWWRSPVGEARSGLWERVGAYLDAEYGQKKWAARKAEELFDRVRPRMHREHKIRYTRTMKWHLPEMLVRIEEVQQVLRQRTLWKKALKDLRRRAGKAVCDPTEARWREKAAYIREVYALLLAWGPEEFARRGMPGEFEVLAWCAGEKG